MLRGLNFDQQGVVQGETSHSAVQSLPAKVSVAEPVSLAPSQGHFDWAAMAQGVEVYQCPCCGFENPPGHMTNVGFQYSLHAEGAQADESLHRGELSDAHETDSVLLLDQPEAWEVPPPPGLCAGASLCS